MAVSCSELMGVFWTGRLMGRHSEAQLDRLLDFLVRRRRRLRRLLTDAVPAGWLCKALERLARYELRLLLRLQDIFPRRALGLFRHWKVFGLKQAVVLSLPLFLGDVESFAAIVVLY